MNKFHAKTVWYDGKKFDSKHEFERYLLLMDKQHRGEIYGLQCQKKFTIIDAQYNGKKRVQETKYIADFAYYETGTNKLVVEDAKGYKKGAAYQLFTVKRKLMLQRHGIWVLEV